MVIRFIFKIHQSLVAVTHLYTFSTYPIYIVLIEYQSFYKLDTSILSIINSIAIN